MYHLWHVPDLEVAARRLNDAGSHPGGGVLVPARGKTFAIINEGSYLPGMKRTWVVAERLGPGSFRPRSSFETRPRTRITAEYLARQIQRVEWPDAPPVQVEAEEYRDQRWQAA